MSERAPQADIDPTTIPDVPLLTAETALSPEEMQANFVAELGKVDDTEVLLDTWVGAYKTAGNTKANLVKNRIEEVLNHRLQTGRYTTTTHQKLAEDLSNRYFAAIEQDDAASPDQPTAADPPKKQLTYKQEMNMLNLGAPGAPRFELTEEQQDNMLRLGAPEATTEDQSAKAVQKTAAPIIAVPRKPRITEADKRALWGSDYDKFKKPGDKSTPSAFGTGSERLKGINFQAAREYRERFLDRPATDEQDSTPEQKKRTRLSRVIGGLATLGSKTIELGKVLDTRATQAYIDYVARVNERVEDRSDLGSRLVDKAKEVGSDVRNSLQERSAREVVPERVDDPNWGSE